MEPREIDAEVIERRLKSRNSGMNLGLMNQGRDSMCIILGHRWHSIRGEWFGGYMTRREWNGSEKLEFDCLR